MQGSPPLLPPSLIQNKLAPGEALPKGPSFHEVPPVFFSGMSSLLSVN